MKRITLYALIGSTTLIIGLASVWLFARKQIPEENFEAEDVVTSVARPEAERPKFLPTARGCGRHGYSQSYELPDGLRMFEGSVGYSSVWRTKREFNRWLAKASKVIDGTSRYANRFGAVGERVVFFSGPDTLGKELANIVWYGGGSYCTFIQAPSLEIALDFEKSNAYKY